MMERPQYFENTLALPSIDATTLSESLRDLRVAVQNGAQLVQENTSLPEEWGHRGLFGFFPGIALAFLRLDYQSSVLEDAHMALPDYRHFALQRIPEKSPNLPLLASRLSPLGSSTPITAVTLRILSSLAKNDWQDNAGVTISKEDTTCLGDAVQLALNNKPLILDDGRKMGGDEMLYGRAGLLWVLLNVRAHQFDQDTQRALSPALGTVPNLIRAIIDSGKQGSKEYIEKHGEKGAHPLMYAWMEGHYCFGAVHGITGILTILLSCKPEELTDYIPVIGDTITALCQLSVSKNGHLPTTSTSFSFGQPSELVQLCHGVPGLLILLGTALKNEDLNLTCWDPSWDQAIYLGTERIWEEGLLSKGGSLCHGIAGNAWAWLLLHDSFEYHSNIKKDAQEAYLQRSEISALPDAEISHKLTGDFFLSRALAFMLHARETKPYNMSPASSINDYRLPDLPYALFEGLAGTVCAWADTCAVIQARLRKMDLVEEGVCARFGLPRDPVFQEAFSKQIGFPGLGGVRATGLY